MTRPNQLDQLGAFRGYNELDDAVYVKLSAVFQSFRELHVSKKHIIAAFVRVIRFRGRTL